MNCPSCNYYMDEPYEEGDYVATDGGQGFNGDYTYHWSEGYITCPKCTYKIDVGDTD